MKIFASGQLTPIKTLKKTAKIAVLTLPLMTLTESCSPWLFPPPPPPHYPRYPYHPHPHRHPHFGLFGMNQTEDIIQFSDVFESSKNDLAYTDDTKQNK